MPTTIGSSQTSGSTAKSIRPTPTSNACVLVVEDDEDTRSMLRTMLEMRGGISVVEAGNGMKAIELAESVHLDLILIDANLPLVDGYEATRRIRELTSTRQVPIVFLSGHAQPAAQAKAFAAGCTEYFVKPFTLDTLGSVVERHLPHVEPPVEPPVKRLAKRNKIVHAMKVAL